jgi:hypothetical protein
MATSALPREDTAETDLEGRARVESLDALHARRRAKVEEYAPLAARFKGGSGMGSSSDAARKRHRALIMQKLLIEMGSPKGKDAPSETALERMANAHVDHIAFCDNLEMEYVKFIVLENEINELNERVRSREVELRCYNAEIGLR